jgi:hypothetical protein
MPEEAEVYVVRSSGESIRLTVADARAIYRQLGELFGNPLPSPDVWSRSRLGGDVFSVPDSGTVVE